ncbi:MAG: Pr6Pr family membrane protein [Spirochaetes bacterium]|nr:Pr6Pr family membrane protein [Spirochaetota bacterium]MBU0955003.1 Pr6Pr family membrane protein [Spirochaetota bacterium]
MKKASIQKLISALCLASALAGVLIMYRQSFAGKGSQNLLARNIDFFGYFTIQSNIMAALIAASLLFSRKVPSAALRSAVLLYILITGSVYILVLRTAWAPIGWSLAGDLLLHYATPLLYLLLWLLQRGQGGLKRSFFLYINVYPILYLMFTLIKGAILHKYPYPFINVDQLGLTAALANSALLCLSMIVLAIPIYFYNNFSKRRQESP